MNTDEILAQLTPDQRKELDADLAALAQNTTADYKKDPAAFSTITSALHLKGNIYLNVTVLLYLGDKDILHPVIENVEQFASLDAYLEALNSQPAPKKK